nr:hypothetical protein [Candidatus Freyrarchaeum guaymaensis]
MNLLDLAAPFSRQFLQGSAGLALPLRVSLVNAASCRFPSRFTWRAAGFGGLLLSLPQTLEGNREIF